MLPSRKRLSRQEFSETLKIRVFVVYNNLGTLKYHNSGKTLFSVVTSSKHEKKAVLRNKLRRRIYNLVRELDPKISGIIYTSKNSYNLSFDEIKENLYELIKKTKKNTQ